MRRILLDFKNRMLAIHTNSQNSVEIMWPDNQKSLLMDLELVSKDVYMKADNFTLDFEANKIYLNESVDYDGSTNQMYTLDMFVPAEEIDAPDLENKFHKVLDKLGYAEVQWNEREQDYLNTVEFLSSLRGK